MPFPTHTYTHTHTHTPEHHTSTLRRSEVIKSIGASSKLCSLTKTLAGNLTRSQIIHNAREIHLYSSQLSNGQEIPCLGARAFES